MLTRCFALLGTTLALIVFTIVLVFDQSQLDTSYLHPVYHNFLGFNSRPQVHAHMSMVLSIILLGFALAWGIIPADRLERFRHFSVNFVRGVERLFPFVLVCLFFWSLFDRFNTGRDKWLLGFAITMLTVILPRYISKLRENGDRFFLFLIIVATTLTAGLTLWHPAVFPNLNGVTEWHVGSILTPMNQFTAELEFGKEIAHAYGILLPAFFGQLQKITGWWTFGEQFTLLYIVDLVYLIMSVLAWRMWNDRHMAYLVVPLLFVFPFLYSYETLITVNHSSLRFFNFALIPLLVLSTRNLPYQVLVLGFLTGISLFINLETSIALTGGMLAYALTIHSPRSILKILSSFLAWALSTAATVLTLVFLLYGDIQVFIDSFMCIFAFSQGFAGLALEFHAIFVLISTHAIYTVFRCFIVWRRGPLSQKQRFTFFVSTTLLVWIAYQMGRSAEVHTETFYSMYVFLLITAIDVRRFRLFWKTTFNRQNFRLSFILCAVLIVVLPSGSYFTLKAASTYKWAIPQDEMVDFGGITIASETADMLHSQIDYLNKTKHDDVLVLSGFSYIIPLAARYYPKNSFTNLFSESILVSSYQKNLHRILTQRPKLIYFDAIEDSFIYDQLEFNKQVRRDISKYYAPSKTVSGWEIWELNS